MSSKTGPSLYCVSCDRTRATYIETKENGEAWTCCAFCNYIIEKEKSMKQDDIEAIAYLEQLIEHFARNNKAYIVMLLSEAINEIRRNAQDANI